MGIDGQPMVYLDLTHIDRATLNRKLEGILEIYEKFVGDDPRDVPMKIFPGMHYTMGGLWVDFEQQTKSSGCVCGGGGGLLDPWRQQVGRKFAAFMYLRWLRRRAERDGVRERACSAGGRWRTRDAELKRQQVSEPVSYLALLGRRIPFKLWRELGDTMTRHATIIRYNSGLAEADAKIVELKERYRHINLSDKSQWANTSFAFTRQLLNMLELSRVVVQGAALRDESRGAHYKPDFPERNDEKFLKTTKASFVDGAPKFEFEDVDISHIVPRTRNYTATA